MQVGYISAPPPVGSGDLGTVGNRPSLLAPPDATNTGPRQSSTQTLTGTQALAAVLAAPVEADGRRYLRRANITSTITFDSVEHTNIVFEDCTINHIGSYTVYGFYTGTVFPSGAMPEFRYCEITGGTASTIVGCSMRFLRCNIHRGEDIIKARETGGEVYACYLHSTYHEADSHSDIVQITSNAIDYLFHWNNMVALNSSDSPLAQATGTMVCFRQGQQRNPSVRCTGTTTGSMAVGTRSAPGRRST